MARLYTKVSTDRVQEHGHLGNERMDVELRYGSKEDSKLIIGCKVYWEKGTDKPLVKICKGLEERIEYL